MIDGSASTAEPPTSYVNFHCSDAEQGEQSAEQEPASSSAVTLETQPMPFHTLILDLAGVCFIDLMGIKVLIKVCRKKKHTIPLKCFITEVEEYEYDTLS